MEGLLLARALLDVRAILPARGLGWVFPDETTAALLLDGTTNLVLSYRPPQPGLYLSRERLAGDPKNAFQRTLANRARGDLVSAEQLKLDRVALLTFSGERGFVDVAPIRLVFELTGRNANVLLLEAGDGFEGRIVAAAREITNARNRFRSVRTGGVYTPPPPYEKLDPRTITPDEARSLADTPIGKWREHIDGLGLTLSAELARRARVPVSTPPGDAWPRAFEALRSLVDDPTPREGDLSEGMREAVRADKADVLRKALREPLAKRRTLLLNQLGDVERALGAYETAQGERTQADLLMAYSHLVEPGAVSASLPDFNGEGEASVPLDPALSAVQNAEKLYARARRREEVFERLALREPALRAELTELDASLARLDTAGLGELELMRADLVEAKGDKPAVGARYTSPSGFEVLVGRNNKENDLLTHKVARSTDFWFHVQGYPGSHVIVRTIGKDLAVPDILMAAALAAHYSKASGSGNVAVDYTRKKNVWKPRGAPAGSVHYTQQKTVWVDPALP
ncbi:Rqc2 family fibronectin-binding protein [Deinococcus yavapaiensis]|uniref:Putative ribosome quality control (RQC) complex YloA/Tae2 family protein n=1 Tax=Deinococcus yavapaiensis KR-236 TaxID=694435 RepID=A0A318SAD2_9DEIO|nr:NFACT family protein [Deinococcus yavapaiensis]PYE56370.1 putative ribosome quality control (RQC) complex YloA/Tae2 family protein [Deinococcus yavapaiensis KR-236]